MSVERINFTSSSSINPVNVNSPTKSSVKSPDNGGILPEQDKQKSNAAKWMIGATALAGIAALAIAGRNGHLGEKVQKFLHGSVDNTASTAKNTAKKKQKLLVDYIQMSRKRIRVYMVRIFTML